MARVTRKHADGAARALNEVLGLPVEPFDVLAEQGHRWQVGCIHVSGVNGGYNIEQVSNEAGACKGLAYGLTVREAWEWLSAAITGAQLMKGQEVGK
jgi:hypothetical protein